MSTTNIQEIKKQIWDLIQQLKNLSDKCEMLSAGRIGEAKSEQYKCLSCYDTKELHVAGSGWVNAPCRDCCD